MAGHYAVTITASRTEVEPKQLADRLAELLHRSAAELEGVVGEQTVVLEKGLSYREATEVQRQLGKHQIPCEVTAERQLSGQEASLSVSAAGREAACAESEDSEAELTDNRPGESEATSRDSQKGASDGLPEGTRQHDDSNATASQGEEGEISNGSGGWADLFPELDEQPSPGVADSSQPEVVEQPAESAEGQAGGGDEPPENSAPGGVGAEASPSLEGEGPSSDLSAGQGLGSLVEQIDDSATTGDAGDVEAVGSLESNGGGVGNRAGGQPDAPDSPSKEEVDQSSSPGQFDPRKLQQAFEAKSDDRPPYEPDGFESGPGHISLLAVLLSLVAPGAGQVYNGRGEKAARFGMTFFLIYPWIESIRQAWKYGEKIRTYYAPRPEKGVGRQALMYGAKWWLVVLLVGVITSVTVSEIQDYYDESQQRQYQIALQQSVVSAGQQVAEATHTAGEAADQAAEQLRQQREVQEAGYTMDDEERARRQFILGYHYCRGREYELCREMMGEVIALAPDNADAFRIQSWASLRAEGGGEDEPMPEVEGEVPTLEQFELELQARGDDLSDVDEQFEPWWNAEGEEAVARLEEESEDDPGDEVSDQLDEPSDEDHRGD